jgi:glycosyltransferase involved in cell wall biosynthesis
MRVVLTTHRFLPSFYAGTEILTYETAKELKRRGHHVEIWTGFPADRLTAIDRPITNYEYDGLPVHVYNHNNQISALRKKVIRSEYDNLFFAKHFREYVRKIKPDVVHFFHLSRLSSSPIEICLENNVPTVFTPTDFWMICINSQLRLPDNQLCKGPDDLSTNCIYHVASQSNGIGRYAGKLPCHLLTFLIWGARHTWWPDKWYSPLLRDLADRKIMLCQRMNVLNRVIAPTRVMKDLLIQNGMKPNNVLHIPYGINLEQFKKNLPKKRESILRVGFIGTLSEHKGAHVLLEAVKLLPIDFPISVKVYGRLDDYPEYVAKLKAINDGDRRIEFCGHFDKNEIGRVFSTLDVLVVPSIWYENTPLVIYSAHASGTPVIGSNLGGISEVVHHEENGLLFEKGDTKGLSVLLNRVAQDRSLLQNLAGNITYPKSIQDYVDELEGVYREVLRERN